MRIRNLTWAALIMLPLACSYTRVNQPAEGTTVQGTPGAVFNTKIFNSDKRTAPKQAPAQPKTDEGGPLAATFDTTIERQQTDAQTTTKMEGEGYLGKQKIVKYDGDAKTTYTKGGWERHGNTLTYKFPTQQTNGQLRIQPFPIDPAKQGEAPAK